MVSENNSPLRFDVSAEKHHAHDNNSQDDFTIAERVWGRPTLDQMRGFLPLKAPTIIGDEFQAVDSLLKQMPVIRRADDGKPIAGLLAKNEFRQQSQSLPDLSDVIKQYQAQLQDAGCSAQEKNDIAYRCAMIFRDYQFLKMGYLFEPVHHGSEQAELCLPENIAHPLFLLAKIFDRKPWLEYASGYVLSNSDFGADINPHDVGLFRSWHGGPDEFYFQTVHSVIEWETPQLFSALHSMYSNIHQGNAVGIRNAMAAGISTTQRMLANLKLMPKLSRPAYYSADVRPQIQGLTGNTGAGKLFDERGVFFEGCGETQYNGKSGQWMKDIRGQTGAQSSIVPLLDNALGITDFYQSQDNPLSRMLRDFRDYRPAPHADLLNRVEVTQGALGARTALKEVSPLQLAQWCHTVCQFREFHYYLAMAYIVKPGLKNQPASQSRNIGTGGSPTPSYLPQNVQFTLTALGDSLDAINTNTLTPADKRLYDLLRLEADKMGDNNQQRSGVVGAYLDGQEPESQLDVALSTAQTQYFPNGQAGAE